MHKSAGIIIKDGALLVLRSKGKDTFYAPGGKLDSGETPEQALCRELQEEVSIAVKEGALTLFGRFEAPAHDKDGITLVMDVFFVNDYSGEVVASNEIEEYQWVDSSNVDDIAISTIFRNEVFPSLVDQGRVK
ncbi:DNA mismatch repair protein MutT [Vibrio sp. 10N.222.52.B12]|uniref:NUDIX hydrolase n=1 Tax=Vibrio sp. 10N.222.52.B12 TaxID=1880840 RepID=UPI000C832E35|nr:NUDIX domain-containing protein [Vibrio sp. 10N.222.52.B12]PMO33916.1 DNA mismatch repair protein MutT [Vibrio sp. 10N.222.52.B12]